MNNNPVKRLTRLLLDWAWQDRCPWQRRWLGNRFVPPHFPNWFNRLLQCDCSQSIHRYTSPEPQYQLWLWRNSFLGCMEKRQRQRQIKHWTLRPLISVLLPVYQVEIAHLEACLTAVAQQLYPHWQLCIVEDGSQVPAVRHCLLAFKQRFPEQVKLTLRDENKGIAVTSQEALSLADGEFIALLDHDDLLAPEALYAVAEILNTQPDMDWIYSDNDKLNEAGQHCCYHSKPDWSPELLLTYNYILHLSVIRRALVNAVGGFRADYEGSQDHDLYLRLAENTQQVHHIRRVLYSWRQSAASVAFNPDNKPYAFDAALSALNAALQRRHETGVAVHPDHSWLGSYQITRAVPQTPNIDVILLPSASPIKDVHASLKQQVRVDILHVFNANEVQNGKGLADKIIPSMADYLLVISQEVQFINANTLVQLIAQLQPALVAGATGKVLNPQHSVDHCGLAYQHGEIIFPLRGWKADWAGHGAYGALPRNVSLLSPLMAVFKTTAIKPLVSKINDYQALESALIAVCFELLAHDWRLVADGGISASLNELETYPLKLGEDDLEKLKCNYPHFSTGTDPFYHGDVT